MQHRQHQQGSQHHQHGPHGENHYLRLIAMLLLSFISMYALMYAMVNSIADVYNSMNQFYMAGLMTAPMAVIELLLMSRMYRNAKWNALIVGASCVAGIAFFVLIRQQATIGDRQFLRSMIPHHSGAILMCEGAALEDQRIKELCKTIIAGQQSEIEAMRALLQETR
jgi:uncharacterized protein (DUF305 family)